MELIKLTGKDIKPYIKELAKLRMDIFREHPYLYDGNIQYEEEYLQNYSKHPSSLCVLLMDNNKIVGASTGMWLKHADEDFQTCFHQNNIPIDQIFYFGESIIYKPFRGKGAGRAFFNIREKHALSLGVNITSFFGIERHPIQSCENKNCDTLQKFWKKLGYLPDSKLKINYQWKDIDQSEESCKPMRFWSKQWNIESI